MLFSGRRRLIRNLKYEGVLKTPRLIDALKTIHREDFIPPEHKSVAYGDMSIPIGHGQFVPQPHTIIMMIEHLNVQEGEKILEVGVGSGWALALLAKMAGKTGTVYGVERIPELVVEARKNIAKYKLKGVEVFPAAALLGLEEHAPYDKMLVSATCDVLPHELVMQLKIGGFMIIPIQNTMCKVTRTSESNTHIERYSGVSFVPLVR